MQSIAQVLDLIEIVFRSTQGSTLVISEGDNRWRFLLDLGLPSSIEALNDRILIARVQFVDADDHWAAQLMQPVQLNDIGCSNTLEYRFQVAVSFERIKVGCVPNDCSC